MSYKSYWGTWAALLVLTLVMILADKGPLPRLALLAVLLGAMAAKAAMIAGNFMHLRQEHRRLILIVALSMVLTGLALFAGIAPDSLRQLTMGVR